MQVPQNALVVVVDGRKAMFLRNEGDAQSPNLVVENAQEQANPADRDQKTDAAGGNQSGPSRGNHTETDYHQQEEDRFAQHAVEALNTRALANDFEALIVIAPPRTLGELRKHYHKEVEHRLVGELAKDLTGHSVHDIEKSLAAA